MHDIEPLFRWRDVYIASEDKRSPFFGRRYSEFYYDKQLYNFYIHPQWDEFGSSTLFAKILFTDYEEGYAIIELMGEWNDALHNDIMYLKRNLIDPLQKEGIVHFVFCCDNVLNFHASGEDDYYAEWAEELQEEGGWALLVNIRQHIVEELQDARLEHFLLFGVQYNDIIWQPHKPELVFGMLNALVQGRIQRLSE